MNTGYCGWLSDKLGIVFLVIMLIVGLLGFGPEAQAYNIPTDRTVAWQGNVGVTGDIPYRTGICATLAPSGSDDAASINGAISKCSTGQVVVLSAGTFNISSSISMRSGVTLRGAGLGTTIIKGSSGSSGDRLVYFGLSGTGYGSSVNISGGNTKGSTTIVTSSAHGLVAGDYIAIDQLEDPTGDPVITHQGYGGTCGWCSRASGTRPIGQMAKVVAVPSSTEITIEIPLYRTYDLSKTPQVTKINNMITGAGLENLTVDNSSSGVNFTVSMYNAANSWLYEVEVISTVQQIVRVYGSYRLTIRNSIFHEGNPTSATSGSAYGPSRGYGIKFEAVPSSANLIENNIFYHHSMAIADEGPFSGNVIAYNFITNMYHYSSDTAGESLSALHGSHPNMNLWEGNYSNGKFNSDSYWGSSSHNTLFRNKITNETGFSGANWIVDLCGKSQYYNVVGNVLGTVGRETVYELNGVDRSLSTVAIYSLGYTGAGDTTASGNDAATGASLLRHGNWDSVTNGVVWDKSISDQSLPASLYLSSKPSWWGAQPWPPNGPDVKGYASSIPAKDRFDGAPLPVSYTVTPSAGPNGSISPNTPRTVNNGTTATFTVTPNAGYTASVGGTCGGTLTGSTYTTSSVTANCTVTATFTQVPGGTQTRPSPPPVVIVE